MPHVAAEEDLALLLAVANRAEALRHAVLGDHRARKRRCLLDVIGSARGGVVEDEFLRGTATQHVGELVEHLAARRGVLLLVGKHHGVSERSAARHDRDLVHGVGARQRSCD